VITHGKADTIRPALARLETLAREAGVELVLPEDEVAKHGLELPEGDPEDADVAVVLGGDGTMLRALKRFLGSATPVIGVNFGSVGFLTSIPADDLEAGLARVFAGDYRVIELRTLRLEVGGLRESAVNDVVARSSVLGRMVELSWTLGGEDLGQVPCDGVICATPAGSTAYNLSNGGPVLVWGLDAMAVSFLAPHSLHARPLVVPHGLELDLVNRTRDVAVTLLVDGHPVAEIGTETMARIRVGEQASLLGSLPEVTFFRRYGATFAHDSQ
jgi:NAD+ kinase